MVVVISCFVSTSVTALIVARLYVERARVTLT